MTLPFLISRLLDVLIYAVLAWAILSWFRPDPRNPLVRILHAVVEPILYPFDKLIPPIGPVSISAFVAILVLEAIQRMLVPAMLS